jgi:hypothetical protein
MLSWRVRGACLSLLGAVGLALALGGCASHPGTRTAAANDPQCIRDTGTRIQDPDHPCLNRPGAAYTQRDIQSTGEIDPGAALKKLDPRVQ